MSSGGGFVMAEADYGDDEMSAADVKAALLDSFYGTERGLAARSEARAEINELLAQLEAKNPNPSPTEVSERERGCGAGRAAGRQAGRAARARWGNWVVLKSARCGGRAYRALQSKLVTAFNH